MLEISVLGKGQGPNHKRQKIHFTVEPKFGNLKADKKNKREKIKGEEGLG